MRLEFQLGLLLYAHVNLYVSIPFDNICIKNKWIEKTFERPTTIYHFGLLSPSKCLCAFSCTFHFSGEKCVLFFHWACHSLLVTLRSSFFSMDFFGNRFALCALNRRWRRRSRRRKKNENWNKIGKGDILASVAP